MKKSLLFAASLWVFGASGCGMKAEQACSCNCPNPEVSVCNVGEMAQPPVQAPNIISKTPIEVGGPEIVLPKPEPLTSSLTECLQNRRSVRAYTDEMLSLEQLSALLWSADGINRDDGKRTAPSARNMQSVSIFATFEKGAYRYDFKDHKLVQVSADDLRPVKLAPLELIFTSNFDNDVIRGIDVGTVSQNAALYCAGAGLATVIRMMRGDMTQLQKALQIETTDLPVFNMAIGFEQK